MKNTSKDTEKLISNNVQLNIFMFSCVETTYDVQKKFYHKGCDLNDIKNLSTNNIPNWIVEKNKFSNIYTNLVAIDIDDNHISDLRKYFEGYTFVSNNKTLQSFFVEDKFRQYILYNVKLKTFMHAIEIVVDLPADMFNNAGIINLTDNNNQEIDLYNCIRNCIVKVSDVEMSEFIKKSEDSVFDKVVKVLNTGYHMAIHKEQLHITSDSGNITIAAQYNDINQFKQIETTLFATNKLAERLEYFDNEVSIHNCKCLFNGRFHTLVTPVGKQYHFIPITYHAQFVWSYLSMASNTIENLNIALQSKKHLELSKANKHMISAMIEKIQILSYDNEAFKRSIENEYDLIYKKFETSWHLASSLEAEEKYINNLNDYLNRAHMEESERINLRQSNILFVISLLQVLAFISIWSDFLDLGEKYGLPFFEMMGIDFAGISRAFSVALPLILIATSLILLVSSFRKK